MRTYFCQSVKSSLLLSAASCLLSKKQSANTISNSTCSLLSDSEPSGPPSDTTVVVSNEPSKCSWVWRHFKSETVDGLMKHSCQVTLDAGLVCQTRMNVDKSGSTKHLIRHLQGQHQLYEDQPKESGIMRNFLARGSLTKVSVHLRINILFY